jgi:HEAT repeat protein
MADRRTWLAIGSCVAVAAAAAGLSVFLSPDRPGAPGPPQSDSALAPRPEAPRVPPSPARSSGPAAAEAPIPGAPSPAHADLARKLFGGSVQERQRAIGEIQVLEGPREFFVPLLVRSLEDEESVIRKGAIRVLSSMGESASVASSSLLSHAVGDPDESVRVQAVFGLAAVQPPAGLLVEALESGQPRRQWAALVAIRESPPKEPGALVPVLARILREHPDLEIRCLSASALGAMGPAASEAAGRLFEMVEEAGESAMELMQIVGVICEVHPPAAVLLENLKHASINRRWAALAAVSAPEPPRREETIPVLAAMLGTDPDPVVRAGAAQALGSFGSAASSAVPALVGALSDAENADLRWSAATALGLIGPPAAEALGPLQRLFADPKEEVRAAAREAVSRIGRSGVPDAELRRMLEERGREFGEACERVSKMGAEGAVYVRLLLRGIGGGWRDSSLQALAGIGEAAVPPLLQALEGEDLDLRRASLYGLHALGPKAAGALDVLGRMFMGGDLPPMIPTLIGEVIAVIGKPAVPVLTRVLESHKDRERRATAAAALGRIRPEGIEPLTRALGAPEAMMRLAALGALGMAGHEERLPDRTIEQMERLLHDPDDRVRSEAENALSLVRRK